MLRADPMAMVKMPEPAAGDYLAGAPDFAGPEAAGNDLSDGELLTDDDEGMGSFAFFAPSFDPATNTGSLLAVDGHGGSEDLQERSGEVVQRLYEMQIGSTPMTVVVWRSLTKPDRRSLELWSNDGYPALVWGGLPRVYWDEAEVVVREKSGRWLVQVTRSLTGENLSEPHLRTREAFEVTKTGLLLRKRKRQEITTPEQRLNVVADLAVSQEWQAMIEEVKALPKRPSEYLQRAALILTKALPQGGDQQAAEQVLGLLASRSSSSEIATQAGNQLLERAWSQAIAQRSQGPKE